MDDYKEKEGDTAPRVRLPVIDGAEDDKPQPEVARIRLKLSSAGGTGRERSKTIAPKKQTREEKKQAAELTYPDDVIRPRTREECRTATRPCPFVSCSHHLYLDVNPQTGAIKLNFPHLEVWQMAETCSLDVADRGGFSLVVVGVFLFLFCERIRQVEVRG